MLEGESQDNATPYPKRAGDILREARIAQGLELADIAARTRIPQRHLESIETGNYAGLPSSTYAIGFAKAYARAIGADEVAIADLVRGELSVMPGREVPAPLYEADEPSRAPSRGLVLGGVLVALAILLGVGLWYGTSLFRGGGSAPVAAPPPADGDGSTVQIPVAPATPDAGAGHVTLTATDEVWVRIYDSAGKTLLIKTLAPGESYDVPADADAPMINVGRPDKLRVTVNGSQVAPLGDGRVAIKDVPIGAAALLARAAPAAQPDGSNTTAAP